MAERNYSPKLVTSVCRTCALEFSYTHSSGMRKKHCSPACRQTWQIERAKVRATQYPPCSAVGCANTATRVGAGLCEKHFGRKLRGAPEEGRQPAYRYKTQAGYVAVLDPSHPLAMANGRVHEHRAVAYTKHDGVCPGCHWCGARLRWPSAVVDHLNEDKADNAPDNLVVACNDCNRARGAMLPFIERLRPEALPMLLTAIATHHERRQT